jgi:hypothetical protein
MFFAFHILQPTLPREQSECHVTSLNQGLCWSVLGREAEVESLACELG